MTAVDQHGFVAHEVCDVGGEGHHGSYRYPKRKEELFLVTLGVAEDWIFVEKGSTHGSTSTMDDRRPDNCCLAPFIHRDLPPPRIQPPHLPPES